MSDTDTPSPALVYVLSTYDEHGAKNAKATLDPAHLPALLDSYGENMVGDAQRQDLRRLMGALTVNSDGEYIADHLGWGGFMLHVIELEPTKGSKP